MCRPWPRAWVCGSSLRVVGRPVGAFFWAALREKRLRLPRYDSAGKTCQLINLEAVESLPGIQPRLVMCM